MRLFQSKFAISACFYLLLSACVHNEAAKFPTHVELSEHLLKTEGGFTVHMRKGNLARSDLYAVSVYPEHTQKLDHPPSTTELHEYIQQKMELLNLEENSLGGWCEGEGGSPPCYLDISRTISDRNQALELGRACDQISVAFLGREKVEFIEVQGTGHGVITEACRALREGRQIQ